MEQNIRKNSDLIKNLPIVDTIGQCFKTNEEHYYRQDKNRVLHVLHNNLINIQPANHINELRTNWEHKFKKITNEKFNEKFIQTLQLFHI